MSLTRFQEAKVANAQEVRSLVTRVKESVERTTPDLAAAYRLCQLREPSNVTALVKVVCPIEGDLTGPIFNLLSDAFAEWREDTLV